MYTVFMIQRASICGTAENFFAMPHMLSLQAACWFFNVIILDSLNISMHTYALPNAMLLCVFYRHVGFLQERLCFKEDFTVS